MGLVQVIVKCDRTGCPSTGSVPTALPDGWLQVDVAGRTDDGLHRTTLLLCELCARDLQGVLFAERPTIDLVALDLERAG